MATKQATSFSAEVLDQLLSGRDPTTVLESDGLIGDLKKALAERMLNAEMDVHLGSDANWLPATIATAAVPRPCSCLTVRSSCRSRATVTAASIRP